MNEHDTTTRIDGGHAPNTLIGRINSEDWVGANLAADTRRDYASRVLILENQIRALEGTGTTISPKKMATHLRALFAKGEIAQATARIMKAAVLFWVAENAQSLIAKGGDGLAEYENAYKEVRALATNTLPKRTTKTSSPKLKALPKDVLDALAEYGAKTPRAVNIGPLLAFLNANLLVGLRPEEWFEANLFTYLNRSGNNSPCLGLRVRNGKTTHGRGNGTHREILLHGINAHDLACMMHFLAIVEAHRTANPSLSKSDLAKTFYSPLGQTMRNALNRVGYRKAATTPTLYSSRHQAVANAKFSGLTDREVAAMFGHSSTSTAKSHYGKKLSGWTKIQFKPSPESISKVPDRTQQDNVALPKESMLRTAQEWIREQGQIR